ncbi:MAG: Rieske 2Fe-2S domain-containing protein, partial [Anaerolineae bacterium]|nr:Rieske 2Fe-2S domain-containing protein [Anaerolineae bacterium]
EMRMNRREFLNIAWLASLGFLVLEISGASVIFSYPRFKEGEFGGIVPFRFGDIPEIEAAPNNFPKVKIWLTNTPDGLMALYKVCPHLGCLYGWSDQEYKFICPCHGSQYEHDGDWIEGPAPRSLDRFAFSIVDEQGQVLAQSDDGRPVPMPDDPNAVVRVDTAKKILGENHA